MDQPSIVSLFRAASNRRSRENFISIQSRRCALRRTSPGTKSDAGREDGRQHASRRRRSASPTRRLRKAEPPGVAVEDDPGAEADVRPDRALATRAMKIMIALAPRDEGQAEERLDAEDRVVDQTVSLPEDEQGEEIGPGRRPAGRARRRPRAGRTGWRRGGWGASRGNFSAGRSGSTGRGGRRVDEPPAAVGAEVVGGVRPRGCEADVPVGPDEERAGVRAEGVTAKRGRRPRSSHGCTSRTSIRPSIRSGPHPGDGSERIASASWPERVMRRRKRAGSHQRCK